MAWIESHQSLRLHPKTLAATALLRMDKARFIGHLQMLWWWALDVADQEGNLPARCTFDMIADAADLPRSKGSSFVNVLLDVGFLDHNEDTGGWMLHDWYDYAGKLNARRVRNREAMRSTRGSHVDNTSEASVKLPTNQPPQPHQPTNRPLSDPLANGKSVSVKTLLDFSPGEIWQLRVDHPNVDINARWKEWVCWVEEGGGVEGKRWPKDKVPAFSGWLAKKEGVKR